ncbi:hypothetical protein GGX14DRAFT_576652 [Mycena pura]|nr:hypothetical protein GGX14DRAFT_576652 [Mycena pura]
MEGALSSPFAQRHFPFITTPIPAGHHSLYEAVDLDSRMSVRVLASVGGSAERSDGAARTRATDMQSLEQLNRHRRVCEERERAGKPPPSRKRKPVSHLIPDDEEHENCMVIDDPRALLSFLSSYVLEFLVSSVRAFQIVKSVYYRCVPLLGILPVTTVDKAADALLADFLSSAKFR